MGLVEALEQVLSEQKNVYLVLYIEWVGKGGQELAHKARCHISKGQLEG